MLSKLRQTRTLTLVKIARKLKASHNVYISLILVYNLLYYASYRKVKTTKKPGITKAIRKARLKWCLNYKD